MKKILRMLAGLLAVFFVVSSMTMNAQAASGSVATNGNQKIRISFRVTDENGSALSGAAVTLNATDYGPWAKTPNLSITAVTDSYGFAYFRISSTYDAVTGYTVSREDKETVDVTLNDYIGFIKDNRFYGVQTEEKKFAVNFYDAAGNVIKEEIVGWGKAATAPEAPAYNGTLLYKMVFTEWDTAFDCIKADTDVNPVYNKTSKNVYYQLRMSGPTGSELVLSNTPPTFTDIFSDVDIEENEDGVVEMGDGTSVAIENQMHLSKFKINVNGSVKNYYGETNEDGTQNVVFVANDDVMYKTSFEAIDWYKVTRQWGRIIGKASSWTPYYTVRFYDAAGNVIDTQKIEEGQAATAPEAPAYNGNLLYRMAFANWDSDFSNVTAPMDVKPVYNKTSKNGYYQLRMSGPTGAEMVLSNTPPVFTDIFADVEIVENENGVVEMGDGTSVAIEDQMHLGKFKINVNGSVKNYYGEVNEDGTQNVVYVLNNDVLYKTSFEAVDWYKVDRRWGCRIMGKAASWTPYYTVRFYDAAGNVIDTQKIEEGKAATAPEAPAYNGTSKYTLLFAGWDTEFNAVTGALDVKPVYEKPVYESDKTKYMPTTCHWITGVDGETLCVTNTWVRIKYVFSSDEDVTEDENGLIDMGDGTFITLDSITPAASRLTLNKNSKAAKYYNIETIDDQLYIVYADEDGRVFRAAASSIDWKSLAHKISAEGKTTVHIYGTAVWEDLTPAAEVPEEE